MEYIRCGNQIVLRLDRGEEISEELLKVAKTEHIALASVSGIGGTDDFDVGVFNTAKKEYDRSSFTGTHEITSLIGSLTLKDGAPYAHLHITLAGKGGTVVGGHLLRCVISLTAEIFITVLDGKAEREYNAELGFNTMVL